MTDKMPYEERAVEWWKEQWNGIKTYKQVCTYVTFACVGFGLGGLFAIRKLIIENPQYLTETLAADTQAVTKLAVGIAATGIVLSQLVLTILHRRFPER